MKILAIKFKYLGDVAITVPALRALREAYPGAEIHFLILEGAVPVVENIPWIKQVWGYSKKRKSGSCKKKLSMIRALRKEKFDLSVDFVGNDRGAWMSRLVGAKKRLGPESTRGFFGRKYCYTHRKQEASAELHERDRQFELLSRIGVNKPDSVEPELYSDPQYESYAKTNLPKNAILCHIATSTASKEWPVEKWAELYNENPDLQQRLIFTSGASDREKKLLAELKTLILEAKSIEETPSIPELMALIDHANAVICGDTFTSHVAAGLKTPLVVLFGPTQPQQWDPKGNPIVVEVDWCKCRHFFYKCTNDIHCLSTIPASKVREALNKLFERTETVEKITH